MKKNWKTRLLAWGLTCALCVSLTPAAFALEGDPVVDPPAEHTYAENWSHNEANHWHACTDPECDAKADEAAHTFAQESVIPATCCAAGKITEQCTACGYEREITTAATGLHDYAAAWSSDSERHWHACTTAGCTAVSDAGDHTATGEGVITTPTCTTAGSITYTCEVCGKTYTQTTSPMLGHNWGDWVVTTQPTTVAGSRTRTCTTCGETETEVIPVSTVTVTFKNGSDTHSAQTLAPGQKPSKPSNPTKSASNRSYTFKGWTTSSTTAAIYTGQSLTTVENVAVNQSVTYYAVYTVAATGQNPSLELDDTDGISCNTSTTDSSAMRAQMATLFNNVTGTALRRVKFSSASGTSYGKLYVNSDKSSSISTSAYYYYSSSTYGSAPLSSVYFQPTGTKGTYTIPYTGYDEYGNTVAGTASFVVGSSASASISYSVSAGSSVSFRTSDFKTAYQKEYSETPRWVEFSTSATLSTSAGTVYYDYDGSSEKAFTKSNIDDYKFYYSSSSYGDYSLGDLSFVVPSDASARTVTLSFTVYYSSSKHVDGTLTIKIGAEDDGDIEYSVSAGDEVTFDRADFKKVYQQEYSETPRWVEFSTSATLSTSAGTVYYDYDGSSEKAFSKSTIDDYKFYYSSDDYGDYPLNELSFVVPSDASARTVTLSFTVYYSSSKHVDGTLTIKIGSGGSGDIEYSVAAGDEVVFKPADFKKAYQEEYSETPRWVEFSTSATLSTSVGTVYYDYDGSDEKAFSKSTIDDYKFYYSSDDYGDYSLGDLSFVVPSGVSARTVTLSFTVYYSSSKHVDGTLTIKIGASNINAVSGSIRYQTTYNTNLQLKPGDFVRFFHKTYPRASLQSVKLGGVPAKGSLYYNYYGTSGYGSGKNLLTASNYSSGTYYYSPTASQNSLSELTYVPISGNYCVTLPFTATGSNGRSLSGSILISVTVATISDVYGVTPKNTAVSLPATSLTAAVAAATGTSPASIQLLELPASTVGTLYVGSGTSTKASVGTAYSASGSGSRISDLRFVPASGFTGSMELPYVAYNTSGTAIASGKFCLGIVNSVKKFSDVTGATWCYKYVTELSDAKVIAGYADGSFKPNNNVTYGAALKLVMLAAGYKEQAPTGANVFSGYLTQARKDGIVTRSDVNLAAPITRLQVAQLAVGAMKLKTTGLSAAKPFTDTADASVQALNAAGIIEGYFSNGTSTYRPANNITRGQLSAIIWRMERYEG